jgi:hypothetical protein
MPANPALISRVVKASNPCAGRMQMLRLSYARSTNTFAKMKVLVVYSYIRRLLRTFDGPHFRLLSW